MLNSPPTPDISTLSLHDALPICPALRPREGIQREQHGGTNAVPRREGIAPNPVLQAGRWQTVFHRRHDRRRSEEHTSELQSLRHLVCRLLLEKKKQRTVKKIYNQ